MDILERLRKLQKEYAWSDYRIAKNSNLSQGTVSNIYKRNTVPNLVTLEAICSGFGITLSQFFSDNEMVELTPELKELFENWKRIPNDRQKLLLELIKNLAESSNETKR